MNGRILLVEDIEEDVLLFQDALARSGLGNRIEVCRDGTAALSYLTGMSPFDDPMRFPFPHVLVLDLGLPKVSGWEVLRFVRSHAEWKSLLVVVLTATLRTEDLQRAYHLGANSFLSKPCRREDLQELAKAFPNAWAGLTDCEMVLANRIIRDLKLRTVPLR